MRDASIITILSLMALYVGSNALLMLIAPATWRSMPEWFRGSIHLSQFDGPTGGLQIRIGGLIALGFTIYFIRAFIRYW